MSSPPGDLAEKPPLAPPDLRTQSAPPAHPTHPVHLTRRDTGSDSTMAEVDLEKGLAEGQHKANRTRDDRSTIHSIEGHVPIEPTRSLPSVSLRRQISPPVVSLFGGVSPDGLDAEEGFGPVRSREEEVARQMEREGKGPDPWAVKFEPGEKINPKVSSARSGGLVSSLRMPR